MKPNIVYLDIETTPHVAQVWGKWDQNVVSFIQYSELLSYSAKFSSGTITTFGRNTATEKELVRCLWIIFDKADAIIAHNGNAFDIPRIMALFAKYKMKPPSPFKQIDTKSMAKKFSFPSNSLNDLADYLGIGRKKETGGIDLWNRCIAGDKAAWKTMLEYNENDVLLLEKVYLRLLPFSNAHLNLGIFYGKEVCIRCAYNKLQSRGIYRNQSGEYTRLYCPKCSKWQRTTKKIEKVKTLRNI